MKYNRVKKGIFKKREKRFLGYVDIDGRIEQVHVKQTGRCEELLIEGVTVFVEAAQNPNRKTRYTLIAVIKPNGRLVNIDSQIPNKMFGEAIEKGLDLPGLEGPYESTAESTFGNSRFDFRLVPENDAEKTAWVEVKGVTLERDGVVLFPDAPTERGLKHVRELMKARKEGFKAYCVFVIQMEEVEYFTPNMETHPAFGEALKAAEAAGVVLLAYDSKISEDSIRLGKSVPIVL